jgi:hypothetical protein
MGLMTRNDLHYKDYVWTVYKDDSPNYIKIPDTLVLNKKEGYEVLDFIDKLEIKIELDQKVLNQEVNSYDVCKKLERMIHDELPKDIRTHKEIEEWIRANWDFPDKTCNKRIKRKRQACL